MAKSYLENAKATKQEKKNLILNKKTKSISKSSKLKIVKIIKKPICLLFLVLFCFGGMFGYFSFNYFCKNDCFILNKYENGLTDITIGEYETFIDYEEVGAKCIAFNKDISKEIKIEYLFREDISKEPMRVNTIDTKISGIYYVIYTVDNIKFNGIRLIRNVIILGEEI